MAKSKKRKRKVYHKGGNNILTYNTAKPNRQARRLGIKPIEQPEQEPRKVTKAAVLTEKVQQAQEIQKKITPKGMTYGDYMKYLKEKRQQLKEKMGNTQ
jgi:hypothetical protein